MLGLNQGQLFYKQWDVLAPLAQRRHVDRDDVQPVEEVLPERARPDALLQILVRRGDDAAVDPHRPAVAYALKLAVLQDVQQLGLQLDRQLRDLVEEDGPAVGELEAADAVVVGAGKSTLRVAEELALEQRGGQRRAVGLMEKEKSRKRADREGPGRGEGGRAISV